MFSQGQLVFAGCFFVAFVIAMIFAYRKDANLHKLFYKGNFKILVGFALFIVLLFVIKIFFKR
jgi:cytochrome bd-type quinol oxidase subunit 1